MAVAISPEGSGFFASSSPLRRSHSQPKIHTQQTHFHSSSSTSRLHDAYKPAFQHGSPLSSLPSSPQTFPIDSTDLSVASTPASNVSDSDDVYHFDSIALHPDTQYPQYNLDLDHHPHEYLEHPASTPPGDSYTVSSNELENSTAASTPGSPDLAPKGVDDIAVQQLPSHHVDYLSHEWKEEDIWASWKYVISNRSEYSNSARLENASWRTWMKSKNKLSTVSPETLNWLKDCDVTWLYGPLQPGKSQASPTTEPTSSSLTKSSSFQKKPILKKRSMSEVMLQQSLSTASLVKQAAAAVQAQQKFANIVHPRRPILSRGRSEFDAFPFAPVSRDNSLAPSSSDASGITSPNSGKRHIHFNEQVEQRISVDVKGDEEDASPYPQVYDDDDSDSDEGIIMKSVSIRKHPAMKPKKAEPKTPESKTIAMLPSTTLKDQDDSPEPQQTAMNHSFKSPTMSPSSSQETLKPSKTSSKFFVDSEDDDSDEDDSDGEEDQTPTPRIRSPSPPRPSPSLSQEQPSGMRRTTSTGSLGVESSGLRRTSSGMLMPHDEGEPSENAGIIGRVIDTVNTARDIAHVVWNVGWRQ